MMTKDSTPTNTILRFELSMATAGGGGNEGRAGDEGILGIDGIDGIEGTGGMAEEKGGHSPGNGGSGFPRTGAGNAVPRPPTMAVKSLGPVGGAIPRPGVGVTGAGSGPRKNSVAPPIGSALGAGGRVLDGGATGGVAREGAGGAGVP